MKRNQKQLSEDSSSLDDKINETPKKGRKKYDIIEDTTTFDFRMRELLENLKKFYANGAFENIVLPIIQERNPIAIAYLDWLVTNYSLQFPVVYPHPMNRDRNFNVFDDYQRWDSVWTKKLFDPYQRGPRIYFEARGQKYETTIAQLNFFSWAIQYGVLDWAARNKEAIKQHHHEVIEARRELIKAEPNREKKRMRLTSVDNTGCLVFLQPMKISLGGNKKNKKKVKRVTQPERNKTIV